MTQRKFKNLNSNTGDLYAYQVETEENWYYEIYHNYSKVGEAPPVIIENSNDWKEITEFRSVLKGRWYIFEKTKIGRAVNIYNDGAIQFDDCFDFDTGVVIGKLKNHARQIDCEASTDQIHQALDAIRVEKGLVEGVKIKNTVTVHKLPSVIYPSNSKYIAFGDALIIRDEDFKMAILYNKGQWAEKVEWPVLVTEDGYEVDEGEDVIELYSDFDYEIITCNGDLTTYPDSVKFFKHKENAQAYIENHKPRYSKADLELWKDKIIEDLNEPLSNAKVINVINAHLKDLKKSKT